MNCLNCNEELKEQIGRFCSTACYNAYSKRVSPETWGIKKHKEILQLENKSREELTERYTND